MVKMFDVKIQVNTILINHFWLQIFSLLNLSIGASILFELSKKAAFIKPSGNIAIPLVRPSINRCKTG